MAGHVFVVHGDLLKIAVDGVLVPCDLTADVGPHWKRFRPPTPADRQVVRRELSDRHVSDQRVLGNQLYRYVDTGATEDTADIDWLRDRVRAGLDLMLDDVRTAGEPPARERHRHLVAMPIFGVGAGGFDKVRGDALRAVLEAAQASVLEHDADVVIVCWRRSDFAALQSRRVEADWADLDGDLRAHAERLAQECVAGRLVLFFGAGLSRAAGLPDFGELIGNLEADAPQRVPAPPAADDMDYPARAERLEALYAGPEHLKSQIARVLRGDFYALGHGLLASLRVREAITTNFDSLYEAASERPLSADDSAQPGLDVLPWARSSDNRRWLLKAHGDTNRSGGLVLTAQSYAEFTKTHDVIADILSTMFVLSREVLFVGYSLGDENIRALIDRAARHHRQYHAASTRVGTIISLSDAGVSQDEELIKIGLSDGTHAVAEPARRLEIMLDYLLWRASRGEDSWLLDPRYEDLLDQTEAEPATTLRSLPVPVLDHWHSLRRRLTAMGRHSP